MLPLVTPRQSRSTLRTIARTGVAGLLVIACSAPAQPSAPAPASTMAPTPAITGIATASPAASPTATAAAPICGGTTFAARWWHDRTFYEVFVRSFADANGDGIGDLRGLTAHLDDLNDGDPATTTDLGITALWLMPVAQAASYHGYDVTDLQAVEPDYGTLADLRALVAAAHTRGIAVILDFVPNHTSDQHPWFQASRDAAGDKADWYVWRDTPPTANASAWHALDGRWYLGQFWGGMPDLNLENPAVTDALVAAASWWMDEAGVDGFRIDAAKHLVEEGDTLVNTASSRRWLAGFRARLLAGHPDALLVAEVYDLTATSAAYVRDGATDLAFDFPLARGLYQAANLEDTAPLAGAQADALALYPPGGYAAFLTNHDQTRVMTELGGSLERAKLAAGLLLTDPGVPFLYYGEEIGMGGRKPDERLRVPMPWTGEAPAGGFSSSDPWQPMGDDWPAVNVAAQQGDPGSLLATYRDLIALRNAHPALRTGAAYPVAVPTTALAATLRSSADEALLVLANLGVTPIDGPALDLVSGPLCGAQTATLVYATADANGTPALTSADVQPPAADAAGGFAGWVPVAEIPARSVVVIRLTPAP